MKVAPAVTFEVDQVFEQAERVEKLLREDARAARAEARAPETRRPRRRTTTGRADDGGDDGDGRRVGELDATRCWWSTSRSGLTSFDVVRRVRRARAARAASGTAARWIRLATGVLADLPGRGDQARPVPARRRQGVRGHGLLRRRDRHRRRGRRPSPSRRTRAPSTRRRVRRALAPFRGADHAGAADYSALKRAGRPLYDYARAGETGRGRAARRGRARAGADVVRRAGGGRAARCAARRGRTCARWRAISGAPLGVGAHVTALRRTRSGPFALADARPLDEVLAALATGGPARRCRWSSPPRRSATSNGAS